jgi:hypothetical protein
MEFRVCLRGVIPFSSCSSTIALTVSFMLKLMGSRGCKGERHLDEEQQSQDLPEGNGNESNGQ